MEEKNPSFEYTYCAPQNEEVRKIREKYVPREQSKLDQLHRLDRGATRRGSRAAIALGTLSTLLLGTGMSCTMVFQGGWFIPGILIGTAGILGICLAYPLYTAITKKERERIAPEILRLTDELLK